MNATKTVAIAKDVLKQLKLNKLRITCGYYLTGDVKTPKLLDTSEDAQKYVDLIQKHCDVCAKGAAILSYARLYDNISLAKLGMYPLRGGDNSQTICGGSKNWGDMYKIFGLENINKIEAAFEGYGYWNCNGNKHPDPREIIKVESYEPAYPKPADRLRAIMINVVRNKGVFKPVMQKTKETT
jgi:hypothetical protein